MQRFICFLLIFQVLQLCYTEETKTLGEDLSAVNIFFYHGENYEKSFRMPYKLNRCADILTDPNFDSKRKTVLFIHGYQETQNSEDQRLILSAYLERGDHNVLSLDYSSQVSGGYLESVMNVERVGKRVARFLENCFSEGLQKNSLHVVGHSLGGQMCGVIGREFISLTGTKLPRLTALDPAFPGYYFFNISTPITDKDAQFVDIIHTDAGLYGAPVSGGHADFYPNGGTTTQPGCPIRTFIPLTQNDLCSHHRSYKYYAESVSPRSKTPFYAIKAASRKAFQEMRYFEPENIVEMGYNCPTSARGNYYLTTNSNPPFAKGKEGIKD